MAILMAITGHIGNTWPFMAMIEHLMTIYGHHGLLITILAINDQLFKR
jgi:hypothetical protein